MDQITQAEEYKPNLKKRARIMIALIVVLLLMGVNLALNTGRLQIERVISGSMEPTLQISDVVLADRYAHPERYDIVIVNDPEQKGEKLIKRIIGMPGDEIKLEHGILYVNGAEDFSTQVSENTIQWKDTRLRVPLGWIFVMGDNRNNSYDSLNFGPVPEQEIRGVMVATIWPPKRWGKVPKFK